MKAKSTIVRLAVLAVLIAAAMIYAANRSRATNVDSAFLPVAPAPPVPNVPKKSLVVHGPFVVNPADLTAAGGGSSEANEAPASIASGGNGKVGGGSGEASGPQSPKPMVSFLDTAGLGGGDPGVAVSNQFVLVSDEVNGLALYDKAGSLVGSSPNHPFANPFRVDTLFAQVQKDINAGLQVPGGLPPGFSMNLNNYGDVRIMFDSYRKRFWIYAMAKNTPPWDPTTIVNYPAVKLVRRDKAAVAVSKTEDPRDGFYTYWWNETIHNGECNVPAGCSDPVFKTSGEGADYPSIGISPKYFLATIGVNRRDPTFKTDTPELAKAWAGCLSKFSADGKTFDYCGPFYVNLMVTDADALASGCPGPKRIGSSQCAAGRAYPLFVDAKNFVTDRTESGDFTTNMARGVKPVVMHGPQSADAYFVNNFIDRPDNQANKTRIAELEAEIKDLSKALNGATLAQIPALAKQITTRQAEIVELKKTRHDLVVWSLIGDNLVPTLYPIKPFTFDRFDNWRFVLNASARDGKLYSTFNQCFPGQDPCFLSVRVLRVNTLTGKTEIDRTMGLNNNFDDNPADRFHYSFPGIEANKNGDIVLVYTRYSTVQAQQRQEVRFSVWYHDEADIRPSRLLKSGDGYYARGTDTAGIAVDPSDDEGVWIAQIFAAKASDGNPYRRIAVGRVFGPSPSRRTAGGN